MGTLDGPIALAQPTLSFDELARLRAYSRQIGTMAVQSLRAYRDDNSGGFFHVLGRDAQPQPPGNQPGDPSKASSATVACFLIRSGRWDDLDEGSDAAAKAQRLLDYVIQDRGWKSAGLDDDNPFTVGFLLELIACLRDAGAELSRRQRHICQTKLGKLADALEAGGGRVSIAGELPNSYLTDLAARVLLDWTHRGLAGNEPLIDTQLQRKIWDGAINSVNEQLALLSADSTGADGFEVGYAVLVALQFPGEWLRPADRTLLRRGLAAFFEAQLPDGSWPRSRRLFRYPDYGDAYCFEFEYLARLLRVFWGPGEGSNRKALLPYLQHLQRAITRLSHEAVALQGGGYGWASGHHLHFVFPESWSTASCFDFCDLTDRLVTDAVTTTLLDHLEQPRLALEPVPSSKKLDDQLDSTITLASGSTRSLKDVLRTRLLEPILSQAARIDAGKPLTAGTPLSVIFYGPPGTSKTTYAEAISAYLGWNLITVDPSHLLRGGFDNIHVEIGTLFRMLRDAERVVVFFDEIDELVRDRSKEGSGEAVSRFLTTSMLPRIIKLRESRRLVYLVATNHIENFDAAFARPGRFDHVLPVMPPTAAEKLRHWPELAERLKRLRLDKDDEVLGLLENLTYDELRSVEGSLAGARDKADFRRALADAARGCVLNQMVDDGTWRQLMGDEAGRIRIG